MEVKKWALQRPPLKPWQRCGHTSGIYPAKRDVYKRQVVGDNAGANSGNPEVISPLNKLQGMLDNSGGQDTVILTPVSYTHLGGRNS